MLCYVAGNFSFRNLFPKKCQYLNKFRWNLRILDLMLNFKSLPKKIVKKTNDLPMLYTCSGIRF